jgi:hypothetical protein
MKLLKIFEQRDVDGVKTQEGDVERGEDGRERREGKTRGEGGRMRLKDERTR